MQDAQWDGGLRSARLDRPDPPNGPAGPTPRCYTAQSASGRSLWPSMAISNRLARQLRLSTGTVKNTPGFVVNRVLLTMINEAFFVLAEGDAIAAEIDQEIRLSCDHPIGPLALADLVGLDVLLSAMQTLHEEFADPKYRPCPLLREMVAAGHLGRKTGRGVYRY